MNKKTAEDWEKVIQIKAYREVYPEYNPGPDECDGYIMYANPPDVMLAEDPSLPPVASWALCTVHNNILPAVDMNDPTYVLAFGVAIARNDLPNQEMAQQLFQRHIEHQKQANAQPIV